MRKGMLYKLTTGQKTVVDLALSLIGLFVGLTAAAANSFSSPWNIILPIIGTVGGYAVSDFTSYVDTGTIPSLPPQIVDTYAKIRPIVAAEIAKLPQDQQAIGNALLDTFDLEASKVAKT